MAAVRGRWARCYAGGYGEAVTPEDRQVIYDLVFVPSEGRRGSPEDVLRHFGAVDGHALGLSLLADAVARQDGDDVEAALIACFVFGMTLDHLELLVLLASADWHRRHEDVANALDGLRTPGGVEALFHLTQWVPDYLAWDEGRGLARKAVWGLAKTPGPDAERALRLLLDDPDATVRAFAEKRLSALSDRRTGSVKDLPEGTPWVPLTR
jgi:hypothetical protein